MVKAFRLFVCIFTILAAILALTINSYADVDFVSTHELLPDFNPDAFSEVITSADGMYKFLIKQKSGDAYFVYAADPNLTVLNIPEAIDGYRITGASVVYSESDSLIRINYPSSTKTIQLNNYYKSRNSNLIPVCTLNLNDEIEDLNDTSGSVLENGSYNHFRQLNIKCKLIVLPKGLKEASEVHFQTFFFENVVIQEGAFLAPQTISIGGFYEQDDPQLFNSAVSVYFTGNASNVDPLAFDYMKHMQSDEYISDPWYYPNTNVTIYRKPDAEGFERFHGSQYQDALRKYDKNWENFTDEIPIGYTVKEYTDEWWKDIKEIQSVEISGEGVTLKKDSNGKGTVTELGWSPSNDPAQYLSREYELSAKPGDSFTLKSSFAPADAFDDRTFFVSLNEDVATVDTESGKVTVLKEGTATIRCVAASGVFSDCFIYSGSAAQTQVKTQAKSDSLKAKTPLIIISCSCAAVLIAGVVILTVKKKRR